MSSSRSAPARTARSDVAVIEPVASDAAASIESVTTTPRKPQLAAQHALDDGLRLRRDPVAVERRVARVADHHERDARVDRRREGRQVDRLELRARAVDRRRAVVGVDGRAAEAGEVLDGGGDAAGAPARARRRRSAASASPGSDRERAAAERRAGRPSGRRPTGARLTVMPSPRSAVADARASAPHGPGRRLLGLRRGRRRPRDDPDLAALLVDGDERAARRRAAARR